MVYELYTTSSGEAALKKLSDDVKRQLLQELQVLKTAPRTGQQLEGEFRHLYSFHVKYAGTDYRVAYEVDEKAHAIIIRYAASRENFYKKLRRLPIKRAA